MLFFILFFFFFQAEDGIRDVAVTGVQTCALPIYLNVLLNQWNNAFYNALQDKNYAVFLHQLVRFSWLAVVYIVVAVYQLYLNQMLQIRWRRWLTDRYLQAWLAGGAYYRMQIAAAKTDNPDQRIAEDLNLFVSGTFGLAIGGLRAAVTLVSFVVILDEATSALDEATEAGLYRLLREPLPEVALFNVGHRGTLRPFHARELVVRSEGKGPARLVGVTARGAQHAGRAR